MFVNSAPIVIDYRSQDFEQVVHDYDLVLESLGGKNLEKSLRVLKTGGRIIGISGPPDPAFARDNDLNAPLRLVISGLSARIRRRARKLGVSYEFLFMRADGDQLRKLAQLVRQRCAPTRRRTSLPLRPGPSGSRGTHTTRTTGKSSRQQRLTCLPQTPNTPCTHRYNVREIDTQPVRDLLRTPSIVHRR